MALPATALEIKTDEDLAAMPDDGNRYELLAGEIIMSPSPEWDHQVIVADILLNMRQHALAHRAGEVVPAPMDVRFSPLNVLQPDILFIRRERLAELIHGRVVGAPDLVLEVLSPGTRRHDLLRKAAVYADHGVPEYWVVDPVTRSIAVNRLRDGLYAAEPSADGRARSTVLPGFTLDPAEVFAALADEEA